MPASSKSVYFATGNRGKVLEARIILKPFGVKVRPFSGKGAEIQAETDQVASFSARDAARKYGRKLIVEDAGLYVEELDGFPGPFSSYAFKTIGIDGLLTLLGASKSRKAHFKSAVAYCEPGGEPHVFEGKVYGRISRVPAGENGFGFDPVFVPAGSTRSMGELTLEEKCGLSHRGEAMRKFAAWFTRA